MKNRRGISLIVLIITIIVIIILAGAVILNLSKNNPLESAKKARFQSDIDTFKSDLSLYVLGKSSNTEGNYDPKLLNADKGGSTENGSQTIDTTRPITEIISSMKGTKYDEKLKVEAGELVYIGDNIQESNWADGLIEVRGFSINVALTPGNTNITGKVSLTGALVDITKLELCKIYLSEESGKRPDTPSLTIPSQDLKSEMVFDITNGVEPYKTYYVIVDVKMSNEGSVRTKEIKVTSLVDNLAPQTPQISKPEYSKDLTISPIAITLTDNDGGSGISKTGSKYVIDQIATNYTEDDLIWNSATSFTADNFTGNTAIITKEVPSDGEYYIHAIAVDNMGNRKSATSSKVIVDTTVPNEAEITIPTNTATNSVQATVKLSDNTNGSGIDLTNCKYIYSTVSYPYGDTEAIWNTATVFTNETQTITVTSSTNEIYYLHVLLVDKAGNRREVLSSGVTTNTTTPVAPVITGTVASNTWTNQNVTLTVKEVTTPGIAKYEYTINGGSWQTYNSTNKIQVTNAGTTTIKARAINNVGTIGAESIGYIVNIDKTAPVITLLGSNPATVNTGGTYIDAGASASDDVNGNITNNITTTSTVNTSVVGTYTVSYKVSDLAGNQGTAVRTVNVIKETYTYSYTGNYQTYIVPVTGNYMIELWGASGGTPSVYPRKGAGAYTKGTVSLNSGETIYIYIGQRGDTSRTWKFNGGGYGGLVVGSYSGGGATDIRLTSGAWDDITSLKSRIMVAAGGGGAGGSDNVDYSNAGQGGYGGTLTGLNGTYYSGHGDMSQYGRGGSQTAGGITGTNVFNGTGTPYAGSFGKGGQNDSTSSKAGAGGGGGGYYGGGAGGATGSNGSGNGAGGGSSFISGYTGCNAINLSGASTGQPNHYSGKIFTNTTMINGSSAMPTFDNSSTMTGNVGNGYAKITYIGQ